MSLGYSALAVRCVSLRDRRHAVTPLRAGAAGCVVRLRPMPRRTDTRLWHPFSDMAAVRGDEFVISRAEGSL